VRKPALPGRPINADRFAVWLEQFAGYRSHISKIRLTQWLDQFDANDRDLAARLLDAVDFFREDHLASAYRAILDAIPGWSRSAAERSGRWRFVGFSRRAGESGDRMLHTFRVANGLGASRYDELFIHKADLLREELEPDDTVVFVDDFAGTGNQAINAWNESLGELLPGQPRAFLVLVAARDQAIDRINKDTSLTVRAHRRLRPRDDLFATGCSWFSTSDKARVLHYCRRADIENPRGYGSCGLLIVFAHRCPNNSLPILHAPTAAFRGLFPR